MASEFIGFEASISAGGHLCWHQTKINGPHNGNWTVNALSDAGVLPAFLKRLSASDTDSCVFVSQSPAPVLRGVIDKAELSNNPGEFQRNLSSNDTKGAHQLNSVWGTTPNQLFDFVRRCSFQAVPTEILDENIASIGSMLFEGKAIFPNLRQYLEENFNRKLTTEAVRADLRTFGDLKLRPQILDRTVSALLDDANGVYSASLWVAHNRQTLGAEASNC